MSIAPRRPCPVCGRLTTRGRCARHMRAVAEARGYDAAWHRLARAFLQRYRWCGLRADNRFHTEHSACARRRALVPATIADHIAPLPSGARLDPRNLQALCVRCNTRKGGAR